MSADIDALYKRAPAVLWVEDPETRAWLGSVWQGDVPNIEVLVAGGRPNVNAVCEQAKDAGYQHVFGLVDQDFGSSNRDRWSSLALEERVYRLDVHEVESLLLDSAALAGCILNTNRRAAPDIENHLRGEAQNLAWWVACCRVLVETHDKAIHGFPAKPPRTISSLTDAERYMNSSVWFTTTAAGCRALAQSAAVSAALRAAHANTIAALGDGSWKDSFPGKPLFRAISGDVQRRPGAHIDLVKAVGRWQRDNSAIPTCATDLRDAIRTRLGLPP